MMIYTGHKKEHIWINKENYHDRPHAYEVACINAEIQNECSSGEWHDSETGQHLFTEVCTFIPDSGYYDNGQGTYVYEYTAHFPLKEGETAAQVFREMQANNFKSWQDEQEASERAEAIQKLPIDIQERLKIDLITIKNKAHNALRLKIKEAEEAAIAKGQLCEQAQKEAIRKAYEHRKNDPIWGAVCQQAKNLVASNQKEQAKKIVQCYLYQQRERD